MSDHAATAGPTSAADFDDEVLRAAFGTFPTGVTVVAAVRAGEQVGMAASSFTSVSLVPPLVSVCIARTSSTWPVLRDGERVGVSVLADDQHLLARQFAARDRERFTGVRSSVSPTDAILIDHACLWLECTIHAELSAGDHVIVLLEVQQLQTFPQRAPLVFHGSEFRQLMFPD